MPPTVEDRLRDILEAIAEIDELLAGASLASFSADKTRRMATERYLEVICDAYHATDVNIVWDVIQNHLPPLKSFVERRIRESGQNV